MLDDAQAHLGVMVSHLVASLGGRREEIYSTALHANALLESLAEVVMAWLLVRQGEIAAAKIDTDDFYVGKLAASRFFVRHVAPKVKARRGAAETEDGWLMNLPDRAF
jgi:hypothetical protein